jgi:hypothetical protein
MDCVDEKGNAAIGYYAVLKLGLIKISYSNLIYFDFETKQTIEKSSFFRNLPPEICDNLKWKSRKLKVNGIWSRSAKVINCELYKNAEGESVVWNCHHPNAETNVELDGKIYIKGFGYAETIILSVAPWKLPISILRWGRFLSKEDTIIWISWEGPYPLNSMWHNGILFTDAIYNKDSVIFNSGKYLLMFNEIHVIRAVSIDSHLLKLPILRKFVDTTFLQTIENKLLSPGTFYNEGNEVSSGWTIHEVVKWNR